MAETGSLHGYFLSGVSGVQALCLMTLHKST